MCVGWDDAKSETVVTVAEQSHTTRSYRSGVSKKSLLLLCIQSDLKISFR